MIEIECLACGKALNIPKYIDADKYEGQVVCQECKSLLHLKLVKGRVEKYRIVKEKFPEREPIKYVEVRLPYDPSYKPIPSVSEEEK